MAAEFYTKGVVGDGARGRLVAIEKELKGCVLWGPYARVEPGSWTVRFQIDPSDYGDVGADACQLDVATDDGRMILAKASVTVADLIDKNGEIELKFKIDQPCVLEYRLFSAGAAKLNVLYHREAVPSSRAKARANAASLRALPLYRGNLDQISMLERGGVVFALTHDVLVARVADFSIIVSNAEDLQLVEEIFIKNDYMIAPPRPCVALDVGMNVGVASLLFASRPNIRRVVGFEPFRSPFERAQRNFSLNPKLAAKIASKNVGLAGHDETREVLSSPDETIGVSIHGSGKGQKETITLRDAASLLGPEIESALADGLGVILKVDCEGSEFAIFTSLDKQGLLPKIDAVFIEWHKWWSSALTQADLIDPLVRAGFFVFDRTSPLNPHAGLLLAVRGNESRTVR